MKNLFSSPTLPLTDLQKFIQTKFDILNANILYITHQVDDIKLLINRVLMDGKLQSQVDDYFDEGEAHLESGSRTSPQTDTVTNLDVDRSSD